jgi:dynein light chain Tctex-type 1
MDIASAEQSAFKGEEVQKIVLQAIQSVLANQKYEDAKVAHWIDEICELSVEKLHALRKPFKYIVTCCISQRTGSALHSAYACHWDTVSDGALAVTWPKRNANEVSNQTMMCIATVFAVGFSPL